MFAPRHHAAMKHVVPVRKELAVRTIFNFLGPLTNPAGASRQLLGVSDRRYQETIAEALVGLGCERALVVCSDDGVDEISVTDRTRVVEVADGRTEEWFVTPDDLGIERAELGSIAGGSPEDNAATVRDGTRGRARAGSRRRRAQRGRGDLRRAARAHDLAAGVERAREAIDSGAARGRARAAHPAEPGARRSEPGPRIDYPALRMSKLDELVGAAREDVERRKQAGARRAAARRGRHAERLAPVQRGAGAAGALADRRVQAPLAELGRDRRRGHGGRGRRRLRARRRRRALGAHRWAQLRRLARRPARRPGGLWPADPAQGLHRRSLPALRGGGQRRRRRAADRRRARRSRRSARSTRRRGCSTSTAWSRSTTSPISSARSRSTPM